MTLIGWIIWIGLKDYFLKVFISDFLAAGEGKLICCTFWISTSLCLDPWYLLETFLVWFPYTVRIVLNQISLDISNKKKYILSLTLYLFQVKNLDTGAEMDLQTAEEALPQVGSRSWS